MKRHDIVDGIIHIQRQVEDTEEMIGTNKKLDERGANLTTTVSETVERDDITPFVFCWCTAVESVTKALEDPVKGRLCGQTHSAGSNTQHSIAWTHVEARQRAHEHEHTHNHTHTHTGTHTDTHTTVHLILVLQKGNSYDLSMTILISRYEKSQGHSVPDSYRHRYRHT